MKKKFIQRPTFLTGDRLIMLSWAKLIRSYDELPEAYKAFFDSQLAQEEFPYTVLSPAITGYLRKVPEKLICEINQTIYVVEIENGKIAATGFPTDQIFELQAGTVLLASWITIKGRSVDNAQLSATLAFNTTTLVFFTPLLNKIRGFPTQVDESALIEQLDKFDYLIKRSFKFMNYARRSLGGGEVVIDSLWQPEIQEPILSLFGKQFNRTVSPQHLAILTDKELILISEDIRVSKNEQGKYGGIWRYLPLKYLSAVSVEKVNDLWKMKILLPNAESIELLFEPTCEGEAKQLCQEIQHLSTQSEGVI